MKLIKFLLLILVPISYCLMPSFVYAEGEFKTEISVHYNIQETGIARVENTITLENVFSDIYATSYTLTLDNIKPLNVSATQNKSNLPVTTKEDGEKMMIVVNFPDALVGKGKSRVFNVGYDDPGIAVRTGEVWEVSIPRVSQDASFATQKFYFSIPFSFGKEAYLSPNPLKREIVGGQRIYYFDKEAVAKTGITAGFGEFQVFSFNLIYHLENPLVKTAAVDIAIPPDTPLQKIYYEELSPAPENVHVDKDGNWLATYLLKPRERVDINTKGFVQIFAGPRVFPLPNDSVLAQNLEPKDFWPTTDPEIISLAKRYKTPKEIYDFVTGTLTYNFERAKPNVVRLGAVEALNEPKNAICMEFTDLFIAIARAAGIPAREIEGFAYTENPQIQPLSLVSDVLHSWPEYWDPAQKTWISIDPTWGKTTGGVDFFNKLDLRHFAFVIHGQDSQKPYPPGSYKLGPTPQKDVFVNFGRLPEKRIPSLEITYKLSKFIPFMSQKISVTVKNNGVSAFSNPSANVFFDGKLVETKASPILPPYAGYSFDIFIPFSFLGTKTPHQISIQAQDANVDIQTSKNEVIISNLALIFTVAILIMAFILLKFRAHEKI